MISIDVPTAKGHPFALPGTLEKAQVVEALQEAALTDERDGTALLNPGHVLAAADADCATFDADRGGASSRRCPA